MRAKVAKRLRRGAEMATVGMPAVEYDLNRRGKYNAVSYTLADRCTRRAYKLYKKLWMKAQKAGHHA